MSKPDEEKPSAGRKPERLKIEGDWNDAVAHALKRGKPPKETPKPKKHKKKRRNNT